MCPVWEIARTASQIDMENSYGFRSAPPWENSECQTPMAEDAWQTPLEQRGSDGNRILRPAVSLIILAASIRITGSKTESQMNSRSFYGTMIFVNIMQLHHIQLNET